MALLVGVLVLGPTVYLLEMFLQNTGGYLGDLVGKTFNLYAYEPTDWLGGWTIFYWGWWISWAPFVGLFIARISRGRTLREFVLGALIAPTLFTLLWMTVFGNSAIALILDQGAAELAAVVQQDSSAALFKFLEFFPAASVLSVVAIAMVFVFFITSADSGAMVLNMLSSSGRDDTPLLRRVFWMTMIGASALLLLLAGGLPALQTAAIASALPFSLVILFSIWGFVRALSIDHAKRQTLALTSISPPGGPESTDWKLRLHNLLHHASSVEVDAYIQQTVAPAMRQFADELKRHGLEVRIDVVPASHAKLSVMHADETDFEYSIAGRPHQILQAAIAGDDGAEDRYFRAEVHLNEGSQDYDVMGWTSEQVRHDILEHYEKHLHFLHVLR